MTHRSTDDEREERILMEIIVDANGPEEQATGCSMPSSFHWGH